eukprot:51941_1
MAADSIKNTLHGWYKSGVEFVMPINEKSEFKQKGVLTPEEFLKAGCQLVYKCPTWSWEGGDKKKRKSFLPDNQQYLISLNLPCVKRVDQLITSISANEQIVENGEWLNMQNNDNINNTAQEIADIDLDAENNNDNENNNEKDNNNIENDKPLVQIEENYIENNNNNNDEDDDDFVIPDMDEFDDNDNVVTNTCDNKKDIKQNDNNNNNNNNIEEKKNDKIFSIEEKVDSLILKTRTYDVSIT